MKIFNIFSIGRVLLHFAILLAIASCSNDFLHEEKSVNYQISDTIKMTDLETEKTVVLRLPKQINAKWHVSQFPIWLKLSQLEGTAVNGEITIDLQVPNKFLIHTLGVVNVPLIFEVEGLGLLQYPFQILNYGYPSPFLSTSHLNLGYRSKDAFYIRNMSQSILTWKIIHQPSWLTVSRLSGYLGSNEEEIISVTVSRDNLAQGNYFGELTIEVNTPERIKTIDLTMEVLDFTFSGQVTAIQGEVIDSDQHQASSLLVFATKNPNRLYYKKTGQTMTHVELDRIPTSVDVSEKGDQLAITFSNTDLSLFDTANMQGIKTIKTGIVASDIALGGNGWAYLCPPNYSTNYLLSVDLNSGTIVQHNENLNGMTLLKKVPGKNLIFGSKVGWGPDFLFVFDISNGALKDQFDQYFMELWNFWLSEDGASLFTGLKQQYNAPEYLQLGYTTTKPLLKGQYEISGTITAIGHYAASRDLFVAYDHVGINGSSIALMDESSLVVKESIKVRNIMLIQNEYLLDLPPVVPYLYTDKGGKELYVIKKGVDNQPKTHWFFEIITLK